jgi:hypothetical protein
MPVIRKNRGHFCWESGLLPRLLHHLDQNFPSLSRIAHFPQECDARPFHPISGFQAHMKAKSIHGGH